MTEAEWLACDDTASLWESDYLWKKPRGQKHRKVTDRKYRLFAVACARRIWTRFPDDICHRLVETSERLADGNVDAHVLEDIGQELSDKTDRGDYAHLTPAQEYATGAAASHAWDSSYRLAGTVSDQCRSALQEPPGGKEEQAQCAIIRDLFPNPFRPIVAAPTLFSANVVAVAKAIYTDRAFDRLPILADALEDAGCTDAAILDHCRQPGEHVRGCWVVDLVLGKS